VTGRPNQIDLHIVDAKPDTLPGMATHQAPTGDPTPSQADVPMTKAIVDIAKPLGIAVHAHIIVGRNGHASFRTLKLIL
jgi:DNA repair protein RadC